MQSHGLTTILSNSKDFSLSSNGWITESELRRKKKRANQCQVILTTPCEHHPLHILPLLPQADTWVPSTSATMEGY
jgi:hypothetical protein